MNYSLFNNTETVCVDDNLVELYEKTIKKLDIPILEYLYVSGEITHDMSQKEKNTLVEESIKADIEMYEKLPELNKKLNMK